MEADRPAIYRPHRPRASPLWQCVSRHLPELRAAGRVRRAVEENVLERFLECGDLHCGFARIRCGGCGHDLLLAFSCKTRYFCPSCHQKRVLLYGEWVEENVRARAAPAVRLHRPMARRRPLIERDRVRRAVTRHHCSVASAQDVGNGRIEFRITS